MISDALYHGKILLFGEYGIIQDSMGLSIPYDYYKGSLKFDTAKTEETEYSKTELQKFLNFLQENADSIDTSFDLARFQKELDGSDIASDSLKQLKKIFGQMESHYHGTSSGLDPLICYLNLPILIKSKGEMNTVGLPSQGTGKGAIFLLNTGMTGKTQPLVAHFLERMKEEGFRNMLKKEFKKYNDASIEAFLRSDVRPLLDNVKELSRVLLDHFKPMIPTVFHTLWKEGIDSNAYYLKLCGSGGGGFILGFTEDFDKAQEKLSDYELDRIYSF